MPPGLMQQDCAGPYRGVSVAEGGVQEHVGQRAARYMEGLIHYIRKYDAGGGVHPTGRGLTANTLLACTAAGICKRSA
jgi:hypothetical protein